MHEYLRRVLKAQQNGAMLAAGGSLHSVSVEHDNRCGIYRNADCDCDPTITVTTWAPGKQPPADRPIDTFTIDAEGRRHTARSHNA